MTADTTLSTSGGSTSAASLPPPGDAVGRALHLYHKEALSRLETWISSEEKLVRTFLHEGGSLAPPAMAAATPDLAATGRAAGASEVEVGGVVGVVGGGVVGGAMGGAGVVGGAAGGGEVSAAAPGSHHRVSLSQMPMRVLSSWGRARVGSPILALTAPAAAAAAAATTADPSATNHSSNSNDNNNNSNSNNRDSAAVLGTARTNEKLEQSAESNNNNNSNNNNKSNSSNNINIKTDSDLEPGHEDYEDEDEVWEWASDLDGKGSPPSCTSSGSTNRDHGVGGALGRLTDVARMAMGARMRGWKNQASTSEVNRTETSVETFILRVPEDTDAKLMTETVLQPKGKSRESVVSILPVSNEGPTIAQRILKSAAFQSAVSFLILANTLLMGVQVELAAREASSESLRSAQIADGVFAVLFAAELLVRGKALGWQACSASHRGWMFFDSLLVTSSMVDLAVSAVTDFDNTANLNSARILRILRITRMIRVLRFIRVVRFIRALRVMIYSIMVTLKSVIWAVLLLFIVIYCFALLFTDAITDHLSGSSSFTSSDIIYCQVQEEGNKYWRNMGVSMMTLLEAVTGGVDWKDPLCPLSDVHWLWLLVFMAFILFTYFAILNVVTAAFCQGAIEGQLYDREQTVKDLINHKKSHLHKTTDIFQNMFDRLDQDSSGDISMEEFKANLADDSVQALLSLLELTDSDLWLLFQMLDSDGSNRLDAHEFISGCMRLKGTARSIDLAKFAYEHHRMSQYMVQSLQSLRAEMNQNRLLLASLPTTTTPTSGAGAAAAEATASSATAAAVSTPTSRGRRERERERERGSTASSSASFFRSSELGGGGGRRSNHPRSPTVSQDMIRPATDRLDC